MLWKLSNYRVPGDAAEEAAATFLRTAWLSECKGSPAPDGSTLRQEAQGSEPQGPRALTMSPPGQRALPLVGTGRLALTEENTG